MRSGNIFYNFMSVIGAKKKKSKIKVGYINALIQDRMVGELLSCGVGGAVDTTLRTNAHFLGAYLPQTLNKPLVSHSKVLFVSKQIVISATIAS